MQLIAPLLHPVLPPFLSLTLLATQSRFVSPRTTLVATRDVAIESPGPAPVCPVHISHWLVVEVWATAMVVLRQARSHWFAVVAARAVMLALCSNSLPSASVAASTQVSAKQPFSSCGLAAFGSVSAAEIG